MMMFFADDESKKKFLDLYSNKVEEDVYDFTYHTETCGCPEANQLNILIIERVNPDQDQED